MHYRIIKQNNKIHVDYRELEFVPWRRVMLMNKSSFPNLIAQEFESVEKAEEYIKSRQIEVIKEYNI
jgi:hypothetical protein